MNIDCIDRAYTAEVLRITGNQRPAKKKAKTPVESILSRLTGPFQSESFPQEGDLPVMIHHGYLPSHQDYHRVRREIRSPDGNVTFVPRQESRSMGGRWLYDVVIVESGDNIIVAVPFHELAEEFFPKLDDQLGGEGVHYERLDITQIVVALAAKADGEVTRSEKDEVLSLRVTKCHLKYKTRLAEQRALQSVRFTGSDLGKCKEYRDLIQPMLAKAASKNKTADEGIRPVVLGFALVRDGVKKTAAVTDQHGNFKVWVAPGLRSIGRLCWLLEILEKLKGVVSTTPNVPIRLASAAMKQEDG